MPVTLEAIAAEAERRNARAMAAAQAAHDNAAPPDDRDEPEDDPQPEAPPLRALIDVEALKAEAWDATRAYARRIGAPLSECAAYEAGCLSQALRRAAELVRSLQCELQIAATETSNLYHSHGHAERVSRAYGIDISEDTAEAAADAAARELGVERG